MIRLPNKQKVSLFSGLLVAFLLGMMPVWADVTVTSKEIGDRVEAFMMEKLAVQEPEATPIVEIIKLPAAPIVLEGDSIEFLLEDTRSIPNTSRTIVQVTMSTEAESRRIGVPVRLMVEKPVWVAAHLIRAKEPITKKDVVLQHKRLELGAGYYLDAKENVTSYTSKVNIMPGTILDMRKLAQTPAVYRNDDVHLILAAGNGVRVSVYGKALEDGAIGKRVRVRQRLGDRRIKTYVGEVIDKNTVLVRI